jgi:hypothetical protein
MIKQNVQTGTLCIFIKQIASGSVLTELKQAAMR